MYLRDFWGLWKLYLGMSVQQHTVYCSLIPSLHAVFAFTNITLMSIICYNLTWPHLCRMGCGHRRLVWMLHENAEVYVAGCNLWEYNTFFPLCWGQSFYCGKTYQHWWDCAVCMYRRANFFSNFLDKRNISPDSPSHVHFRFSSLLKLVIHFLDMPLKCT